VAIETGGIRLRDPRKAVLVFGVVHRSGEEAEIAVEFGEGIRRQGSVVVAELLVRGSRSFIEFGKAVVRDISEIIRRGIRVDRDVAVLCRAVDQLKHVGPDRSAIQRFAPGRADPVAHLRPGLG
jgi:hypothetical protein